ncbi:hypothetical protein TL18_03230 [Methanobrevibacter sp. YE315]|uniref:PH domain-containing protein n=1 Tax=Methanobrevibacter sp. YE315 TaxID=1609968 RepID=UPI000764F001|nr:PH domain-containing protein [Methanobrevibacter sp. YE315]AMD17122.1 hypothetical protein TL18_03230 [Methanobrevibacter sp. YE315]
MLFNKNDTHVNDRILYQTKPNMLFGCKKAVYGLVLLGVVLIISPMAIQFIGEMQVYLISQIKLPLTRYIAIAFFVIILIIVIYIIWQLVGWYSMEYTLTESRIIVKSGVLSTKKIYMPYATIQDVNTSQNIIEKLFNIGSVSIFSAYDNNLLELKSISNPSEAEEIIFSRIMGPRNFQPQSRSIPQRDFRDYSLEYPQNEEYYDEFEPITPINREKDLQRREYEYYPENLNFQEPSQNPKYEYEPYDDFENNVNYIMEDLEPQNDYPQDNYYDRQEEYSYGQDYHDLEDYSDNHINNHQDDQGEPNDSSETAIRRHFDKFRK